MANDNDGKISSGDTARDIAKVKEAFNSTAAISGLNKEVTNDQFLSTVMAALPIGLLLLVGLHVLMSKFKAENGEEGEKGVVRAVSLIVIGLVMLLAFIYMTTTE